ncbi:glycoside hydrolase family 15 protein [Pseudomonas sp. CCI3.2]|uniref:glycoside hydrolase family 15 protein n=1 Tax=unclassified Pseudomonas TaxID=196821 RepID=UPI002AC8E9C8|nr:MULTISPECIES: glycoside hydrolase family 15 protein [unclassified Pseudomonas]MEB0079982.1 glycoside hydrolase family 15 protein [Pseudomonas sp. MH10out]MEB0102424.1 glycoside hydrolase family 15 protein [Pseudomonas sp. CCI3.2]MEB0132998.1 glycoside hydrolase family 15 protein [Pseudomonas sp. CCI2.4]MEB0160162.1 glycoside hydrolase family 15 protein [Pseudomonas sp. AH2 (2023)]MEB0168750.1 glycoside hydrolase family 15 protein [Pseudomonas sp. CCC4.4]
MVDRHEAQNPIENHGIIGDMRGAALVADTGSIDFCCWPDFDSPSIFTALLDTPQAGIFQLAPDLPDARRQQIYLPNTNILQTRWIAEEAVIEVTDLMPITHSEDDLPRIVRRVNVRYGRAMIHMRCAVRLDYSRANTQAQMDGEDVCFSAPGQPGMRLSGTQPLQLDGQAATAEFELKQGEFVEFILGAVDDSQVDAGKCQRYMDETLSFWRTWSAKSNYRGRWRETVHRSALALKLLTSRKHGAIIAAATFGLPEATAGTRNWDYRYTWIRDASFTVYAFMRLGHIDEANAFMRWVRGRMGDCCDDSQNLGILYALDGREELPEEELSHLSGFGGASPVRIGNEAYQQTQLDIYGELMDAVYLANKYGEAISYDGWKHATRLVDQVCEKWRDKDVGIWEMRGQDQHFLHSRLMCWVALDRALRLAFKRSLPAPFDRWDKERQAIHDDIWSHFWDKDLGHFSQHIGSRNLDASMLLMPLVRFVGASDPRWLSTLEAIERHLVRDGMVYRYRNDDANGDGLEGDEGAFTACSFWYVECLARAGRVDQAHLEFEQLLRYANPLGLYAEEFDTHGRHLGNTPQALSHLALISAASFLDRKLDHDDTQWQP